MEKNPSVLENWSKGDLIGKGGFGMVYKVKVNGHDTELAVKIVEGFKAGEKALGSEIKVLENLEHERILPLVGHERRGSSYCLFFPYMSKGSLESYIERHGPLNEDEVRRITKQILEGLCYLHGKLIIHRDLKGSNVLLDTDLNIKLADFGLSKLLDEPSVYTATSYQGTCNFMAPELWRSGQHTFSVDIWALGCTVVQMITGQPPFPNGNSESIQRALKNGDIPVYSLPEGSSPEFKSFLDKTFQ